MNAPNSNHAAELVSGTGTGVGPEPGDEALDGEGLWELGAGAGAGAGASVGARASVGTGTSVGTRATGVSRGSLWYSRRRRRRRRGNWSSGGAVARTRTRARSHGKVDARLVALVDCRGVPEPLNDTVAFYFALSGDVGHLKAEFGPFRVLAHGNRGKGVLVPADEGLADNLVSGSEDNRNVGMAIVGSTDLNLHVDLLARGVGLDLGMIGEWDALALPDAAVRVAALKVLDGALDIAVAVRVLSVVDTVTAGSLEASAGLTGRWADDEAVASDRGGEACDNSSDGERLHCGGSYGFAEESERGV